MERERGQFGHAEKIVFLPFSQSYIIMLKKILFGQQLELTTKQIGTKYA